MPSPVHSSRLRVALLLSGAASLVHEVVWNRSWVLVFGSTLASTATVLAAFMGGMALGAWAAPRLATRWGLRGLDLYRRLEALIAAGGLLAPLLLLAADGVHLALARAMGPTSWSLPVVRVALAGLALVPLAALMGATLPAVCQELDAGPDAERAMGALYAWNTAGAVLGVLVGSYVLLPALGVRATTALACLASLGAAALAPTGAPGAGADDAGRDRAGGGDGRAPTIPDAREDPGKGGAARLILTVYAFVGFWGMALEVLFARAVLAAAGASTYAFAAVLGAFLIGIAGGSAAAARWLPSGEDPLASLGRRLATLGLLVAGSAAFLPRYPDLYLAIQPAVGGALGSEVATWALSTLYLLPAGLGLGALFPVAARSLLAFGGPGVAVGRAYLVNSLGGAAGSLAAYYVVAPLAGIAGGLYLGAGSLLLAGAALLWRAGERPFVVVLPVLAAAWLFPLHRAQPFVLDQAAYRFATSVHAPGANAPGLPGERAPIVWYRDGPDVSVAVASTGGGRDLQLRINGKTDASLLGDGAHQAALGTLPMLVRDRADQALMVGLGAGGSAQALLLHPVRHLATAEISPTVLAAAGEVYAPFYPLAFDPARSGVHLVDGRLLVRAWPTPVDLILSQPTNLYVQGVTNLYTREFFEAARDAMTATGVMVFWVQDYHLPPVGLRAVARTMTEVFPHVALVWLQDFFFLASRAPVPFEEARMRVALDRPGVAEFLDRVGLPRDPAVLRAAVLAETGPLRAWSAGAPVLVDDQPFLEFLSARARFADTRTPLLAAVDELRGLAASPGPEVR